MGLNGGTTLTGHHAPLWGVSTLKVVFGLVFIEKVTTQPRTFFSVAVMGGIITQGRVSFFLLFILDQANHPSSPQGTQ